MNNTNDLSTKLFDQLRLYSKQVFLSKFIPADDKIYFNNQLCVGLEVMSSLGKNEEDCGYPYLELRIFDPDMDDYNIAIEVLLWFDITFDKITNYEHNNCVEMVPMSKEEAFKIIKLYFEQLTHRNIEELYRKVQLLNIEMV